VSEAWAHSKSATGKGVETRRTHAAYRRGRFKLIRSWSADAVHEELYDIDQDPLEERNLLADDVVTSDTIARAADTLRATADAHSALESEVGARHATGRPPFPEPSASEMSPERLEALRMLGYIE